MIVLSPVGTRRSLKDFIHMCTQILIALVGFFGVLVGTATTLVAQWLDYRRKDKARAILERPRRKLLKEMLEARPDGWRELSTLAHVIGTDDETTKRLLIEIGARASETKNDVWALIRNKPLPG